MTNRKQRHRARRLAFQAIYQWEMTEHKPVDLELQFREANDFSKIDEAYFSRLVHGVITKISAVDEAFENVLDRKKKELNPVELSILRLATYELLFELEVPYKVVINEALELTKTYGATEGYKYVNAVLDAIAPKLRPEELR